MKTQLKLAVLALLSSFIPQPSALLAQGSLTPPGPPGPTMKTLQQVEPRTPIGSAPFTVTQPGSYYLTTNLTVSSGDAIVIATNGVTLDLNGFSLRSTAPSAGGTAILINSGLSDIAIFNGHIRGGVTNAGGVYNGPGFGFGIVFSGLTLRNVRVSGVSVSGCRYDGINLVSGDSTVVEGCTVRTVGGNGIVAGVVKGSVALECGGTAIWGQTVSDCRGESTGSGTGVYAFRTAQNCYGTSVSGDGVSAETAQNCYGFSNGSGYGVYATTAQNCYGFSNGSGDGVYAITAQNCYGFSNGSGDGVFAITAQNCYGFSNGSGYGVYASTAQNCYGFSNGSGYGVYATRSALNCYGSSGSGPAGLSAQTAAFCVGYRSGGRAIWATLANGCWAAAGTNFITYKYNMP